MNIERLLKSVRRAGVFQTIKTGVETVYFLRLNEDGSGKVYRVAGEIPPQDIYSFGDLEQLYSKIKEVLDAQAPFPLGTMVTCTVAYPTQAGVETPNVGTTGVVIRHGDTKAELQWFSNSETPNLYWVDYNNLTLA